MLFWNETNVTSCLRNRLRHNLIFLVCFVFIILLVHATPQFFEDTDDIRDSLEGGMGEFETPEKRPARLSYFRAPFSSGRRGRYGFRGSSYGSYGYGQRGFGSFRKNDWWRKKAVNRYMMPWDRLPNTNCLRKYCQHDGDCCRRFSKCNKRAHVCYDCWYGHPCRTHFDCCAQYPYCNQMLNTCGK